MSHPSTPQPESAEPRAAYETRDVDWRSILLFAGLLVGVAVLIHIGLYLMLLYFQAEAKQADPKLSPLANEEQAPPAPRLQDRPTLDYKAFADREQEELNKPASWVNRQRGVVQIPIDRAMELLIERGLPETKPQPKAAAPKPTDNDNRADREQGGNEEGPDLERQQEP